MCIYNVYHVLVLRQFNMLIVQAGDDDCVGNECSDVEARVNEARRGAVGQLQSSICRKQIS